MIRACAELAFDRRAASTHRFRVPTVRNQIDNCWVRAGTPIPSVCGYGPAMARSVDDRGRGARLARRDEGGRARLYVTEGQRSRPRRIGRQGERLSHSPLLGPRTAAAVFRRGWRDRPRTSADSHLRTKLVLYCGLIGVSRCVRALIRNEADDITISTCARAVLPPIWVIESERIRETRV